jgi:hypothetical protein
MPTTYPLCINGLPLEKGGFGGFGGDFLESEIQGWRVGKVNQTPPDSPSKPINSYPYTHYIYDI